MKKVLIVFGTRPEAIKMAPLVRELFKFNDSIETKVCTTAQHREMLDQVLDFFKIVPDYDLNLMRPDQNLYSLTSSIIESMREILEEFKPDFLFVHGDTTTTMAASIAGFYAGVRVCHVEAGLRTNNKNSPFPEEINRQITTRISDFHFAPTQSAKLNLEKEGVLSENIHVVGNTVIDSLLESVERVKFRSSPAIDLISRSIKLEDDVILVTGHRRENHGDGFERICAALREISLKSPDTKIIYPVHLNPRVQEPVRRYLSDLDNVQLIEPLSYPDFVWLMQRSKLIITDSGGIQEEAPSLGKPVLVIRDTTERPEAVEAGTVILVGTVVDRIVKETMSLLENNSRYETMSKLHNPYGDGEASKRIVQFINQL